MRESNDVIIPLAATGFPFLNWRARHIPVGTKHAAVAWLRTQERLAAPAVIEPLASIGRHCLGFGMPTFGTYDGRGQLNRRLCLFHSAYTVMPMNTAKAGRSTTSSMPTKADSPTAPNKTASTGVKQQSAATIVPMRPALRRVQSFIDVSYPSDNCPSKENGGDRVRGAITRVTNARRM